MLGPPTVVEFKNRRREFYDQEDFNGRAVRQDLENKWNAIDTRVNNDELRSASASIRRWTNGAEGIRAT